MIAILPARGGSKRIPHKNIADFFGKPMIAYALDAARSSNLFKTIHVSTDSDHVADAVKTLGFPIDFRRDPALADDITPLMPVLRWVLETYEAKGRHFETVCLLMPCAPLVEASDLIEAHRVFMSHSGRKPVMAVAAFPVPVEWAYSRKEDGSLVPVNPGAYAIRSQDLEKKFYDAGAFYFYHRDHILSEKPVRDADYASYVLPRTKAVDIDDEDDLKLARALYQALPRGGKVPAR